MKKTVCVEIMLVFIFSALIAIASWRLSYVVETRAWLDAGAFTNIEAQKANINTSLIYSVIAIIAALCDLAVMVITAIKDFPVFKPLVNKFTAKRAAHKEQREAIKAEQAEAAKQARIEQLQAVIDELKKDE